MIKLQKVKHNLVWGTEDWIISAHQNGDNKIKNLDKTLSEFYNDNKSFFGNCPSDKFPLLVKIIDAKDDLSIQVHPGDEYAGKYENSLGKTECWYILDADKDSDIVVGQKAKTREELQNAINNDQVMEYMDVMPVNKDDFFFIPNGVVHAIRSNTKILEIQQSSDITYRLYDYKRPGVDGNLRELHIDKSLDVINYDFKFKRSDFKTIKVKDSTITVLTSNDFFEVLKVDVVDNINIKGHKYFTMGICIDPIVINGESFNQNETFIIESNKDVNIEGTGRIFISTYGG